MTIARKGMAFAALLLTLSSPAAGSGPERQDPRFGVAATYASLHGPGVALDLQLTGPVAVIGRIEGIAYDQARGVGLRYDALRSERLALFAMGMGGVIKCDEPRFADRTCDDRGPNMSVAAGAGAEVRLTGRWSLGLEGSYWQALEHDDRYYDNYPSHFNVAAAVRVHTQW